MKRLLILALLCASTSFAAAPSGTLITGGSGGGTTNYLNLTNKPTLGTAAATNTGTGAGNTILGNDARLSNSRTPLSHNQAWGTITAAPTSLSGYGITDALPKANPIFTGTIGTTNADGTHFVQPYNSVAFSGTPAEGMLQTTPTGLQLYTGGAWGGVGGASSLAQLSDWPAAVSATEVGFLNGVTSGIQAQISALVTGSSGYVAVPTYSNSTCIPGQWSAGVGFHYSCVSVNTWDRIALSAWNNPTTSSYLVDEGYEGIGQPVGWTTSGTVNYDYAPAMDGTESLAISTFGAKSFTPVVTPVATIYATAKVKFDVIPGLSLPFMQILGSNHVDELGTVSIMNNGGLRAGTLGGADAYSAADVFAAGTAKYVKLVYTKGTGADSRLDVYTSADGVTGWALNISSTNGTALDLPSSTANIGLGNGSIVFFDTLKVSDSDILDARSGY